MIVLGFDTSTPATAVALTGPDAGTREVRDDPPAGQRPAHAQRLLALSEELLGGAALPWRAVDRVAVGVGPGSFTGLRIGVAAARALSQALAVPAVGVSSLRALAAGAVAGPDGPAVLAVLDARRGEVYAAAYRGECELVARQALAPEALGDLVDEAGVAAAGAAWLAVGDGAIRFRSHLEAVGVAVPADADQVHRVSAVAICRLAAGAPASGAGALVPDYVRRPDAERSLRGASPEPTSEK